MLSFQWVTVVQKICPTDGSWVSWPAQLVASEDICHQVTGICRLFLFARIDIRNYNSRYLVFCYSIVTFDGISDAKVENVFVSTEKLKFPPRYYACNNTVPGM